MHIPQDSDEELGNDFQSIIEASKIAVQKYESRFECLEDTLDYSDDRLHRSLWLIAQVSKSANHDT